MVIGLIQSFICSTKISLIVMGPSASLSLMSRKTRSVDLLAYWTNFETIFKTFEFPFTIFFLSMADLSCLFQKWTCGPTNTVIKIIDDVWLTQSHKLSINSTRSLVSHAAYKWGNHVVPSFTLWAIKKVDLNMSSLSLSVSDNSEAAEASLHSALKSSKN